MSEPQDEIIGKYRIIETLGKGSMGLVYKAEDPEIGRVVALKTLKSVYLGDDSLGNEALLRFKQESRSAGQLQHPNIVRIFEAGKSDDGSPFIAMELIEGKSLELLLQERGKLHVAETLHYMAQIADAIDYAHGKSIIHRDIKPSNVLIGARHQPYLLDFGVAKLSDTSLTPVGTIVGTPSYMSPEQIRGEPLDGRTDVFSLAVLVYEALSGKRPFPGQEFTTVVSNIIQKEPLSFTAVELKLPAEFEAVLLKGLAKKKDERFANCLELIVALGETVSLVLDGRGLVGGYRESREKEVRWSDKPKSKKEKAAANNPANAEVPTASSAPWETRHAAGAAKGFPWIFVVVLLLIVGGAFYLLRNDLLSGGEEVALQQEELASEDEVPADSEVTATSDSDAPELPAESPVEEVIEAPLTTPKQASLQELSIAALGSVITDPNADPELVKEAIREAGNRRNAALSAFLASVANADDYTIRVEALKSLSKRPYIDDPIGFEAIQRRLDDDEFIVRGFAVKIIGAQEAAVARPILERRLSKEQHRVVQKLIQDALAAMQS